ncbi:hypothetical protein ACTFIW_005009 [Dictyostelium discoideum]
MMFGNLPDVRKPKEGYKKYLEYFDLRFPRIQEEKHFQSYYYYTYLKQIRISIIFLTSVLFIGTMTAYISPLDISYLPYYDSKNIYYFNYVQPNVTSSSSTTNSIDPTVENNFTEADGHLTNYYFPYLANKARDTFILRMITIGLLLFYFIFTFTAKFKRLWKLFTTITLFLVSCIVLIFESDIRTIPGRMVLLFIIIAISSGMTFLPSMLASGGLCLFFFFYFMFYSQIAGKQMVLLSLVLLISWIILMIISRFKEQLFRDKFRTLENLKIQTIRSEKIINQMLPTVVVQRLRLQSSKDQSLETTLENDKELSIKKDEESNLTGKKQSKVVVSPPPPPPTAAVPPQQDNEISTPQNSRKIVDPQSPSSLMPGQYSVTDLIVDSYDPVTVLFCEIVNFNALVEKMSSTQVINLLNEVYNSFDRLTDVYGVTKVEHIGNVYMVVGGCPELCPDHAQRVAHMSLGMLSVIRRFGIVQVRIGMHTGPVVGGIIGKKKLSWHLFGDTINTSSRMASHSSIGRIQVSHPVQQLLRPYFLFEDRGKIQVKGKGLMRTFYLVKTKQLDKRYTSIFSSLHREKPYIPPVDISEVSFENQNNTIGKGDDIASGSATGPTHPNIPNSMLSAIPSRVSIEMNPLGGSGSIQKRERKGSIFANVMPPKVLNFLQTGSLTSPQQQQPPLPQQSNSEETISNSPRLSSTPPQSTSTLQHSSSTGALGSLINNNNNNNNNSNNNLPISPISPISQNTTPTGSLSLPVTEKKKQTVQFGSISRSSSISKGTVGRSPSPALFDGGIEMDDNGGGAGDDFNTMEPNLDLGKGIHGSNVISTNNSKLNKLEKDLTKHYTLDKFKLSFISRGNLVEKEYRNEYILKNWNRILASMLMIVALFGLSGLVDYFFLKLSSVSSIVKVEPMPSSSSSSSSLLSSSMTSSEEKFITLHTIRSEENLIYDIITGVRYGFVFFCLIVIYVVSKFKTFSIRKWIQEVVMVFFIVLAAVLIVLTSVPPLNKIPLDSVILSIEIMFITICYNFSGIKFWYSNIVCAFCIIFIEISKTWKQAYHSRDIYLSHNYYLITAVLINIITSYFEELFNRLNWVHGRLLDKDQRETESLVAEILPADIVKSMKSGRQLIVDEFKNVTIFLSDIVGFTEMAARMSPRQLVETLNQIYSTFDEIAQEFGVLKIATIGDAYFCVSGCPDKDQTDHAFRVANMAIKMLESIKSIRTVDNIPIRMRIGIHTGPVIAGVVGIKMIHYQLWGESVQITQQMESTSRADMIHVSEDTFNILKSKYLFEERPDGIIKKRKIKTYFLLRALTENDPQPEVKTRSVSVSKSNFGGSLQYNQITPTLNLPVSQLIIKDQNEIKNQNDHDEEDDENGNENENKNESSSSSSSSNINEEEEEEEDDDNSNNNNNNEDDESSYEDDQEMNQYLNNSENNKNNNNNNNSNQINEEDGNWAKNYDGSSESS